MIIFFVHTIYMYSQDVQFSQLAQTQLFSNPAFAGIQYGPRFLANLRSQYPRIGSEVNSGYNSYYLSYDQFADEINSGFAAQVLVDKYGSNMLSRYSLIGNYTYQAKFNEYHAIRIGIGAGYTFQQMDNSQLRFFDQIDPIHGYSGLPTIENIPQNAFNKGYFNFQSGLVYFNHQYYFGLSARNILPKKSFYTDVSSSSIQDLTLSAQFGGVWWLNKDNLTAIYPSLLYDRQYGYQKLTGNALFQYNIFNLGLGFRHNFSNMESIMLITGFNFKKIRISYSYDISTNEINSYSGGSHELGLRFLLQGDDNSLHPNEYKNVLFCPDFMRN